MLRGFIAGANAQYRAAGMGAYQMHVARDGSVTTPNRPRSGFKPVKGTEHAAASQAAAGATQVAAAPKLSGLKPTANGFEMTWGAVSGATKYGVWVDGKLAGHVPKPSFAGTLAASSAGVLQIDAVRADGTRSEATAPIRIAKDGAGKLAVSDPTKPASDAATVPAAAAP